MQIVTRSQSRIQGQFKSEEVLKLQRPMLNSNKNPVVASIIEQLNNVITAQNKSITLIAELVKENYKVGINNDSLADNILSNENLRALRFQTLEKNITMLSSIAVDIPALLSTHPNYYNKLLEAALKCINQYYDELRINWDAQFMPKTPEEENIINLFIQTIQSTEKILKSNIPDAKRSRTFVIYTGMDTIEPESETENIDIWADTTIKYDPDYVPTEDDEEDDDEEDDDEEDEDEDDDEEDDEDEDDDDEDDA